MLKHVIGILLILQALLLGHLIIQTSTPTTYATWAEGGRTTQVSLTPPTPWGGAYGNLGEGTSTLSISAGGITKTDITYNDPDNNCSKTELIATTTPADPTTIGPIEPYWADQQLGIPSTHSYSTVQMFNELHTYNIAGNDIQLWSLRTRGELGDFIQGIGQSGGDIVFVTTTSRNTQSYNGEPANYQLLLPSGTWTMNYDDTDSCSILDEYTTQNATANDPRLDAALPQRICTGQENTIYAVYVQSRTYCTPDEVGRWYCQPTQADASIRQEQETLLETTTEENGTLTFTPAENTRYELRLSDGNQTIRRSFTSATCGEYGDLILTEDQTINYPGVDITPPPDSTGPSTQEPGTVAKTVAAEYVLITLLTMATIILSAIGYYNSHKDNNPLLLKLRIWILEHLR